MDKQPNEIKNDTGKNEKTAMQIDNVYANDDYVVFVPAADIRVIERVLDDWDLVIRQWDKWRNNEVSRPL